MASAWPPLVQRFCPTEKCFLLSSFNISCWFLDVLSQMRFSRHQSCFGRFINSTCPQSLTQNGPMNSSFGPDHGHGPHPLRPDSGGSPGQKGCLLLLCCAVATVAGPMARDVDSLVLCLRALLSKDMHQLDPTVPFMPFREEVCRVGEQIWRTPASPLPSFLIDLSANPSEYLIS